MLLARLICWSADPNRRIYPHMFRTSRTDRVQKLRAAIVPVEVSIGRGKGVQLQAIELVELVDVIDDGLGERGIIRCKQHVFAYRGRQARCRGLDGSNRHAAEEIVEKLEF